LLLDEPLSALDAKIRVSLRNEIRAIQRQLGITTIYVTHDQEEALSLSDRVVVMNQGVVEQVGPPFEIYNFPKTAFVASFVGTLNVVEATVLDPAAGALQVAGQTIHAPQPLHGQNASQPVKLALRPELFAPEPSGVAGENCLKGMVENVVFLGAVVRVHVRVGPALVLMDEFNNPNLAVPTIGQPIELYFQRENCLLLAQ
jgi:putative spermidine/putrescine transport system ATP-binding protein